MTAPSRVAYRPRPAEAKPKVVEAPEAQPVLRVVPAGQLSPRAQRRRARVMAVATALLVGLGLFGLVAFHVILTEGQLQLDSLQARAQAQQERYDRNRLALAELEAPGRIVAVAQERLGMVPPPDITYLSPTGVKVGASSRRSTLSGDPDPATSWPTVKAHLAGRP